MKKVSALIFLVIIISFNSLAVSAYGPSTMYVPPSDAPSYGVLSPRSIQLTHNGNNNGRIYATFEECSNGVPAFPIFESTDEGETWIKVGSVYDTQNGWGMMNCPQLYELPQKIGNMDEGTLICVGNSCPKDKSATRMDMYKSTDLGRSWTFISNVATGGANSMYTNSAVWEPFLLAVNNKLICYFSDERDSSHCQKIVHAATDDGMIWSSPVEDVAWPEGYARPGMPVIAQLANGNYIMTFEVMDRPASAAPCMYKINTNPETGWNECTSYTLPGNGNPYVIVLSDGRIAVNAGGSGDIFINTEADGSGSWLAMGTPINSAYNRCMLQLDNGRLLITSGGGFVAPDHNSIAYADMWVPSVNGSCTLLNENSKKVLGILGGNTTDGVSAVQWTANKSYDQKWQLVDLNNGYVKLINVKTGKALGIWQGSKENGARAVQWNDNGSYDQQWSLAAAGSFYKLINRNSGKCLGAYQASAEDGAQLVQWNDNGSSDQLWSLQLN
ncbi:RICIN domain-containing protein [Anaerocolumna jejuensis]|uniref:RICIN domain-containing protein n=1 Tax=Anaerocolumna jejuensis TaxID=259063 RepID=UPI003F7C900C